MTPRKDDNQNGQSGINDIVMGGWKGLPATMRAGLIWGPLGLVFVPVVLYVCLLAWDHRIYVNKRNDADLKKIESDQQQFVKIADAVGKMAEISESDRLRSFEFSAQVTKQHDQLQQSVVSNGEILGWAKNAMKDVPAMREESLRQQTELLEKTDKQVELLESLVKQQLLQPVAPPRSLPGT